MNKINILILSSILAMGCDSCSQPKCINEDGTNNTNEGSCTQTNNTLDKTQALGLSAPSANNLLPYHLNDPDLALVGDTSAETAFSEFTARFKVNTHDTLAFNIYKLKAITNHQESLRQFCHNLTSDCTAIDENKKFYRIKVGSYQFSKNKFSGAERFVDRALFHKSPDDLPMLTSRGKYIDLAKTYIANMLPHVTLSDLHSYKFREYKNYGGTKTTIDYERTYQIALSYNQHIDNLPVIGSGGKIAVHMSNDGRLVSIESSVRSIDSERDVLDGDDLLSPDDARTIALDRLRSRGVTNYMITSEQFGYLERGRNSAQGYLIPHYAFFFAPNGSDDSSKRMVEVIPATLRADIVTLADQDDDLEAARKQDIYGDADEPDAR